MTDDERAKYAGLISLRNTEVTLRWTRTQLFLFINAIGLPLVVTQQLQHSPGMWFRIITGGSDFVAVRWGHPVTNQVLLGLILVSAVLWLLVVLSPLFW